MRFYTTELHGYRINGGPGSHRSQGSGQPGFTVTIHDRAYNCRAVASFASEDSRWKRGFYNPRTERRNAACREHAAALCDELNAGAA